jgi:transcriptional regulator with XRE-family HTH domain
MVYIKIEGGVVMSETTIVKSLISECRRSQRKLTRVQIAKAVGIDDSTIAKLETGVREVRFNHIQPLCDYFGVTADYLLGRTSEGLIVYYYDEAGFATLSKNDVDSLYASNELEMKLIKEGNKEYFMRVLNWSATARLLNEELEAASSRQNERIEKLDSLFGIDTTLRKLVEDLIYIDNVDESRLKQIQDITTLIKSVMKSEIE